MTAKERYYNNREMLNHFRGSASAEMQKVINSLMMLNIAEHEPQKARIDISVGKAKNENAFISYLSAFSREPITKITSYDNSPQIIVYDHPEYQKALVTLDLTSADSVTINDEKEDERAYYICFTYSIPERKIDYRINLTIFK